MTEPKPQWEGLYDVGASSTNAPDYVTKFTGTINGEPLSTEQLHELIVSQSMTIDRLLTEIGRLNDDANEYGRLINGYRKILDDYKAIVDFYQKDKP